MNRLSETRDSSGRVVAKMCCLCFEMIVLDDLYVDEHGDRWDMCCACGVTERAARWRAR